MFETTNQLGLGWESLNVLDRTSYVVDVTLKVLGWGGGALLARSSWIPLGVI
jgi:hypothetical protein